VITELAKLLNYDPLTGQLTWKQGRISKAGCCKENGYVMVKYQGKSYRAHLIIWYMMTGREAEHKIDHEDHNGYNNRWTNLREAPGSVNHLNNQSTGVTRRGSRHLAQINYKGQNMYLGSFQDHETAAKCVADKRAELIAKELT
jgi:Demerecviridae HNH endonuclease